MVRYVVLAMLALLLASAASAQDVDADWDLTENPERGLVAASATFSSGITIALRCLNGQYDALIGGLPEAPEGAEERPLSLQFGDQQAAESDWYVGTNRTVAVSDLPARLARQLRDGGLVLLRVREPGDAGRRLRFDLQLPASATNVDRTLSACDRPTHDPRDALVEDLGATGLPSGIEWARPPEPSYPDGRTFERGFVVTSCLNRADGLLTDCVIESEFPLGGGFGEAVLRSTRRARVRVAGDPDAPVPIRMIIHTTRFRMMTAGEAALDAPSRIPRRPRD